MLPSVVRPMRSLPSGIKKCINGRHLPHWLGRCLTSDASYLSEELSQSFVTGPLTMLSEEEEMMKETGTCDFAEASQMQKSYTTSSFHCLKVCKNLN